MLGDEISTEGPIHILVYSTLQLTILDAHSKSQLEFVIEQSLKCACSL